MKESQSPAAAEAGNTNAGIQSDDGSYEIARSKGRWHRIEMLAPYVQIQGKGNVYRDPGEPWKGPTGRGVIFHNESTIDIRVRELQGKELGALASPNFSQYVQRAEERKNQEDYAAYGKTTRQLEQDARNDGYYGSRSHRAWAEAAEARTGGRLSSEWWMKFDPYGGTAGNGPEILATGKYPGTLSKISMGHDTDWSLGRHFQAGPMRGLYGANHDSKTLGKYGLDPFSPIKPGIDIYTNGHPDWKVDYLHRPRRAQVDQTSNLALAFAPGNDQLNRQFEQALKGTLGDRDAAALAVDTISKAPGYKPDQDISVMQGKSGLLVSQGQGESAVNLQLPQSKQGDFERLAAQMTQPQQTQQLTAQPETLERKGPTMA
jgi:hypothetical protein